MLKVLEERQSYIGSVLDNIKCISEEIAQKSVSKRRFHNLMQQRIINLANSFNLEGLSEYRVDNIRADGRDGLIDVVWLADSRPVTAFEIDSRIRIKSIKKLLAVKVPFRFWVYYGPNGLASLIQKYNPDNLIQVIQLQDMRFKRFNQPSQNFFPHHNLPFPAEKQKRKPFLRQPIPPQKFALRLWGPQFPQSLKAKEECFRLAGKNKGGFAAYQNIFCLTSLHNDVM